MCDLGILVLDSRTDLFRIPELLMQVSFARLYGIKEWIVSINQMDLQLHSDGVPNSQMIWNEQQFDRVSFFAQNLLLGAGYSRSHIIGIVPTSCHPNWSNTILAVNEKLAPWYSGLSLIDTIESATVTVRKTTFLIY
jgi:translation elongation factor EF-1alpha